MPQAHKIIPVLRDRNAAVLSTSQKTDTRRQHNQEVKTGGKWARGLNTYEKQILGVSENLLCTMPLGIGMYACVVLRTVVPHRRKSKYFTN